MVTAVVFSVWCDICCCCFIFLFHHMFHHCFLSMICRRCLSCWGIVTSLFFGLSMSSGFGVVVFVDAYIFIKLTLIDCCLFLSFEFFAKFIVSFLYTSEYLFVVVVLLLWSLFFKWFWCWFCSFIVVKYWLIAVFNLSFVVACSFVAVAFVISLVLVVSSRLSLLSFWYAVVVVVVAFLFFYLFFIAFLITFIDIGGFFNVYSGWLFLIYNFIDIMLHLIGVVSIIVVAKSIFQNS
jgi:hypothetical protein